MQRHDISGMLDELKLAGIKSAFDEVTRIGLKRQHPVQQFMSDLLAAGIAEKQVRSVRC